MERTRVCTARDWCCTLCCLLHLRCKRLSASVAKAATSSSLSRERDAAAGRRCGSEWVCKRLESRVLAMECKYAATNRFYGYCSESSQMRIVFLLVFVCLETSCTSFDPFQSYLSPPMALYFRLRAKIENLLFSFISLNLPISCSNNPTGRHCIKSSYFTLSSHHQSFHSMIKINIKMKRAPFRLVDLWQLYSWGSSRKL